MTCRELTDFLLAYVDRELPDDVRRRFDTHVATCPECAAYLGSYEATVSSRRRRSAVPTTACPTMSPRIW